MAHLKEAEPCSEREAKVRPFRHCPVFSVPETGTPPPAQTEPGRAFVCLDGCLSVCVASAGLCIHTPVRWRLKPGFVSWGPDTPVPDSAFAALVQVPTWSRSLVYTLEELECKICYNGYDSHSRKPKLLGCLHRVCAQCLKKMAATGECTCSEIGGNPPSVPLRLFSLL